MPDGTKLAEFVAWCQKHVTGDEKGDAQLFLDRLFQAFGHVLREDERKRGAFARVCFYVLANPGRAKLVAEGGEWPFSGVIVPGYPELHPMQEDVWEKFWKLYAAERDSESPAPSVPPLQ